jgi:hypothetical protein
MAANSLLDTRTTNGLGYTHRCSRGSLAAQVETPSRCRSIVLAARESQTRPMGSYRVGTWLQESVKQSQMRRGIVNEGSGGWGRGGMCKIPCTHNLCGKVTAAKQTNVGGGGNTALGTSSALKGVNKTQYGTCSPASSRTSLSCSPLHGLKSPCIFHPSPQLRILIAPIYHL